MNFFRSRLYSVRRPDGFAIRRKKGSTYYARGFVIPYPIDMLATAWLLGIANPQSIKRLGHFLTADCKSAGTPSGRLFSGCLAEDFSGRLAEGLCIDTVRRFDGFAIRR